MSYVARLRNLVSVCITEEDARPEYMETAGGIGGLLDCVEACDGPLGCCIPLEVMNKQPDGGLR